MPKAMPKIDPIGDGYGLTVTLNDELAQHLINSHRIWHIIRALYAGKARDLSPKTAHVLIGMGHYQMVQRCRYAFDITTTIGTPLVTATA